MLLAATPALAQEDTDTQVWTAASGTTKVAPDLELGLETIARFGDDAGGLYEAEYGGSLTWAVAKGIKLQIKLAIARGLVCGIGATVPEGAICETRAGAGVPSRTPLVSAPQFWQKYAPSAIAFPH